MSLCLSLSPPTKHKHHHHHLHSDLTSLIKTHIMIRISNILIAFINTLTLVTSLAAIGASFWFLSGLPSVSPCQKFIQQPLLILGSSLFLLSFFALIGSCCRVQFFLWIYLFFLFVLIVGLMCFTVFAIVVTNKGVGEVVSGRGYKEHRLGNYSNWLQNYVLDDQHWDEIKSCFVELKVCKKIEDDPDETRDDLIKRKLSPIQGVCPMFLESGCCKPPTNCGKNAAGTDTDCETWSTNEDKLCYDCESCKAGVLENMRTEWRSLAIINGCILFLVILIYSIGCCALRSNRSSRYHGYKGYR
ncbi:unnamed protein product [Camellia sinensis]